MSSRFASSFSMSFSTTTIMIIRCFITILVDNDLSMCLRRMSFRFRVTCAKFPPRTIYLLYSLVFDKLLFTFSEWVIRRVSYNIMCSLQFWTRRESARVYRLDKTVVLTKLFTNVYSNSRFCNIFPTAFRPFFDGFRKPIRIRPRRRVEQLGRSHALRSKRTRTSWRRGFQLNSRRKV